jgi:hypothetical protein
MAVEDRRWFGHQRVKLDYSLPFGLYWNRNFNKYEVLKNEDLWRIFKDHYIITTSRLRTQGIQALYPNGNIIEVSGLKRQNLPLLQSFLEKLRDFSLHCQALASGEKSLHSSGYFHQNPTLMLQALTSEKQRRSWDRETWYKLLQHLRKVKRAQVLLRFASPEVHYHPQDFFSLWRELENPDRLRLLQGLSKDFLSSPGAKERLWQTLDTFPMKGEYLRLLEEWLADHPEFYASHHWEDHREEAFEQLLRYVSDEELQDPKNIRRIWEIYSQRYSPFARNLKAWIMDHPCFIHWDYLFYLDVGDVPEALDKAYQEYQQRLPEFKKEFWKRFLTLPPRSSRQRACLQWLEQNPEVLDKAQLRLPFLHQEVKTAKLVMKLMLLQPETEDLVFLRSLPDEPWRRGVIMAISDHLDDTMGGMALAEDDQGGLSEVPVSKKTTQK